MIYFAVWATVVDQCLSQSLLWRSWERPLWESFVNSFCTLPSPHEAHQPCCWDLKRRSQYTWSKNATKKCYIPHTRVMSSHLMAQSSKLWSRPLCASSAKRSSLPSLPMSALLTLRKPYTRVKIVTAKCSPIVEDDRCCWGTAPCSIAEPQSPACSKSKR